MAYQPYLQQQKLDFKNQDDDVYDIESDNEDVENILNLSRQNLTKIPSKFAVSKGSCITVLILTKNKLSSFTHFNLFPRLRILQLDRNNIGDELIKTLPHLNKVQTLWLNNNNLKNLKQLLFILKTQCPQLEYLSLLFNPLCPFTTIDNDTNNDNDNDTSDDDDSKYVQYKRNVMSYLPKLKYLDISGINNIISKHKLDDFLLNSIEIDKKSIRKSIICDELHLKKIIYHCSSITHFVEWKCFYNTSFDGISKNTFYNQLNKINDNKSLIIIKDTINHIFGAYIDGANWKKSYHYKGSFDCFVFHFGGRYSRYNKNLYIHKSTGIEPYYLQCNDKDITIGSGESPALYFDMEFNNARTTSCKTFNSPPLTRCIDTQFTIHTIEIWAPKFQ